jgi:hypothetical protein
MYQVEYHYMKLFHSQVTDKIVHGFMVTQGTTSLESKWL